VTNEEGDSKRIVWGWPDRGVWAEGKGLSQRRRKTLLFGQKRASATNDVRLGYREESSLWATGKKILGNFCLVWKGELRWGVNILAKKVEGLLATKKKCKAEGRRNANGGKTESPLSWEGGESKNR